MKTVDTRWTNLAIGRDKAEQLDGELRKAWELRLVEARENALATARARWDAERQTDQRTFAERHARWQAECAERRRVHGDQVAAWTQKSADEEQRLNARAGRGVVVAALAILALHAGLGSAVWACLFAATAFAALCPALSSVQRLARLRAGEPSVVYELEPKSPVISPESRLRPVGALPNLVEQWWEKVSYDPGTERAQAIQVDHGTEGVTLFCEWLAGSLPDDYVVVRDLLVEAGLDVDVLVVGPTGIWVFEVKHWTGTITCRGGEWTQARPTWYGPDGEEARGAPDIQWAKERTAVEETLRRLPQAEGLVSAVRGGILFSHPSVTFDVDGSQRALGGDPKYWIEKMWGSPILPQMTPENQMRVLEALLNRGQRLPDKFPVSPGNAADLAKTLFSRAADDAREALASLSASAV